MENFIDIDESCTVTVEDYLNSIGDVSRRSQIAGMFDWGVNSLNLMKSNFGTSTPVPEVQIKITNALGAEASPFGLIIVTEGMIDHCLDTPWPMAHEVIGSEAPYLLGENLIARLGLAWVLCHEYTHLFHCHHLVEQELGSDLWIRRAFEYDSDLCATAVIYRTIQRLMSQVLADVAIRRYAAFAIFWIIRSIPEQKDKNSAHPPFSERYFQIILKLITLAKDATEAPDPNVLKQRTVARAERVREAGMACEAAYQAINGIRNGSYFSDWLGYFADRGHTQITRDWIKISPVVARLAGEPVDMKSLYIDLKKAKLEAKRVKKAKRKSQSAARRKNR